MLLGDKWNSSQFDWAESVYKIRDQNFPVFFPIIMSVDFDNKNSTTYSIKVKKKNTIYREIIRLSNEVGLMERLLLCFNFFF